MSVFIMNLVFLVAPPLLLFSPVFLRKNSIRWKQYLWMYILLMRLLAFSYAPKPNSGDLVRYFSRMEIYVQYELKDLLNKYNYREIGETIWIWIAAKLDLPGIIPGIASGIVYGVGAYITCDYSERKDQIKKIKWLMLIQFLFLPFNSIVNNVFNVSAFALELLAIYRDLVQRKHNIITVLLYVIPCFIQQTAFLLIILRFLAIPVNKLKYFAIIIVSIFPGAINLFYKYRNLINYRFIVGIIERANYYLNETSETEYAIRVQTVLWHRINFWLNMMFSLLIIIEIVMLWRKEHKEEIIIRENTYISFLFLDAVLAISCIAFSAPHYWRFNLVLEMAIGFLYLELYTSRLNIQTWTFALSSVAIGSFIIQFYRIIRSAVYLDQWSISFILSTPIQIIVKLLKNFLTI